MWLYISIVLFLQLADVPFKAKDEFSVEIDFQYKNRVSKVGGTSTDEVPIGKAYLRTTKEYLGGTWPYLRFKTSLIRILDTEKRMKITDADGNSVYNRKIKANDLIVIDAGFIDELKDHGSTRYTLMLLTEKKVPVSRIEITIDKDGNYFVNGARYGKF